MDINIISHDQFINETSEIHINYDTIIIKPIIVKYKGCTHIFCIHSKLKCLPGTLKTNKFD